MKNTTNVLADQSVKKDVHSGLKTQTSPLSHPNIFRF